MNFFPKKKAAKIESYIAGEQLLANACIITDEIHAVKKLLIEMKSKNNVFIPSEKLDELIEKYSDGKLLREINAILNAKTNLLEAKVAENDTIKKLQGVFSDKPSNGLKLMIDEVEVNFTLIRELNALIVEQEELIIKDILAKKSIDDTDIKTIKTVDRMKEADVFIKSLINCNKRIAPAIKQNLEIARANQKIAFLDFSIKQTEELAASVKSPVSEQVTLSSKKM